MAERFLFLPSFGLIAAFVLWVYPLVIPRNKTLGKIIFGWVLISFSILTIHRNQSWKSNESLMQTDIAVSYNSARLQNQYGTLLLDKAIGGNQ